MPRAESKVKPIVMSYETWALVPDIVDVHELPAEELKGISRSVVPFVVDGLKPAAAD